MKIVVSLILTIVVFTGCGGNPPGVGDYFSEQPAYSASRTGVITSKAKFTKESEYSNDRKISLSAELIIEVTSPDSIAESIFHIVHNKDGLILSSNNSHFVLRFPAEKCYDAIDEIEALGLVIDRKMHGRDVTDQYTDYDVRLNNALNTRDRYLQILKRASNIQEIIKVEKELERINSQIEMLKGRIGVMANEIEFWKVTVDFRSSKRSQPGPITYLAERIAKGIGWLFVWN